MVHGRWVSVTRIVRVKAVPVVPPHPDPERLLEIQKAMADKGYFKGEVNGVWNADSIAALKQFQTDQKLTPDGKITALSLIGLGLGPKHDGSVAAIPTEKPSPNIPQ
jgi:peptidoglycan hydrolase-like protein with peptidoglycan-binding domain